MKYSYLIPLLSLLLVSCADTSNTPSAVAEQYWQAIYTGDTQTAKSLITKDSLASYDKHMSLLAEIETDSFVIDDVTTVATTIIKPESAPADEEISFETRLVLEDGTWKVDLTNTDIPAPAKDDKDLQLFSDELSQSMQNNVESMEEAVNEGIDMLNDVLREGSEEMNRSMLEAMEELNRKMHESIDKMKERRQQKPVTPPAADDSGEGLI